MDLSQIGADVFGITEAKVLRALSRLADPVSGRHLTKLAGAESHSTVQRYLHRLRKVGLVHATETSSATLYRLNRDHVFWKSIEEILAAPARIDQAIVERVAGELGSTARVAAFGSVASGTSGPDSDYDLLVVLDDSVPREARDRMTASLSELVEGLTGNEAQVIDVSQSELRDLTIHGSPIVAEWRNSARPLDGRGRIPQLEGSA